MLPTPSDVHVDAALTNISIAFLQNASNFVASRVFPMVPVDKQSDRYFTIDRGDFNRDEAEKRASGTESAGGGYRIDNTPTFYCDVYAFHRDLPWQVLANADTALDLRRGAADFVAHKMLIKKEKDWASTYFTGGVWTNDFDGVSATPGTDEVLQWNDANSDPIGNIRAAVTAIEESTGFTPNTLTVGKHVMDALEDHPDIVDRIKYSGMTGTGGNPARVSANTLAQLFGLERVLTCRAIENTADEGQVPTHSFIQGKKALLTYSPPAPGLMTPSAGYTFVWNGYLNQNNGMGFATSRFNMDHLKSERVEGEMAFDHKLVAADLGFFWDSIVA